MNADPGDKGLAKEFENDPRVYLAAERTLLAWIRTGLAMMGFGFVVARFDLFLRELVAARNGLAPAPHGRFGLWAGTGLVVLGVVVNVLAGARHVRFVHRYRRGLPSRFGLVSLGIVLASLLAAMGLVMAFYLLKTG